MINGHVVAHRVLVNVPLRAQNQAEVEVAFVIDTGFTGFLTLPPAIVAALNLPFLRRISASLADGSKIFLAALPHPHPLPEGKRKVAAIRINLTDHCIT